MLKYSPTPRMQIIAGTPQINWFTAWLTAVIISNILIPVSKKRFWKKQRTAYPGGLSAAMHSGASYYIYFVLFCVQSAYFSIGW